MTEGSAASLFRRFRISSSMFGITLLCFLLPFVTVSCQGVEVGTLSGVQLAAGTTLGGTPVEPVTWAIIALIIGASGFLVGFMNHRLTRMFSAVLGALGVVSLLGLQSTVTAQLTAQTAAGQFRAGFWLTMVLFLVTAAVNLFVEIADRSTAGAGPRAGNFSG